MRKLILIPSEAGYAVDPGVVVLTAQLSGGPSRTRLDFLGAVDIVNVGWAVGPDAFNYLQAFYRTASKQASESFLIDLIIDGFLPTQYQAKFVPGSYRVTGVQGLTTILSAQLEVVPNPVDEDLDNAILDGYEIYGDDASASLNALSIFANQTAPDALPA